MAGSYKLIYFDFRGRAETARMLFHLAGVKYDDHSVPLADWPAMKDSTPFGQMPLLEVDGETLWQGKAIARFLARRFGFAGKSDVEEGRADAIVESTEDAFLGLIAVFKEQDKEKRAENLKKFVGEDYQKSLSKYEGILKNNKNGTDYFVGSDLTWADLAVYNQYELVESFSLDLEIDFTDHPLLKAHRARVRDHTAIAQYLATRKKDRPMSYFSVR